MSKLLFDVHDPCPECSGKLVYVSINPPEETEGRIAVGQLYCTTCDWCMDDLAGDDRESSEVCIRQKIVLEFLDGRTVREICSSAKNRADWQFAEWDINRIIRRELLVNLKIRASCIRKAKGRE